MPCVSDRKGQSAPANNPKFLRREPMKKMLMGLTAVFALCVAVPAFAAPPKDKNDKKAQAPKDAKDQKAAPADKKGSKK